MAEQITPISRIENGFVDYSQTPSPYASLIHALSGSAEDALNYLGQNIERERKKIEEQLSSPLLTTNEIDEIEKSAKFPVSKLLVQNRRGQAIAENMRQDVEDRVSRAKDPIEAREILRQAQQEAEEQSGGDAGIRAGIREHFAELAPRLLDEASAQRKIQQEFDDRASRNEILTGAVTRSDPDYFAKTLEGQIKDQMLVDPKKVAEIHSDAAQTLLNRYAENDATGPAVVDMLDHLVTVPGLVPLASDKNKYFAARDAIEKDMDAAGKAAVSTKWRKEAHRAAEFEVAGYLEAGVDVPDRVLDNYYATAEDKLQAKKWIKSYQKADGSKTVVGSDEYKASLANLKASLKDSEDPSGSAAIVSTYQRIAAAMDPSVLDDPAQARTTFEELANQAKDIHEREELTLKEFNKANEEQMLQLLDSADAALKSGDLKTAARLQNQLGILRKSTKTRIAQRKYIQKYIYDYAESLGFDIQDDLVNLTE